MHIAAWTGLCVINLDTHRSIKCFSHTLKATVQKAMIVDDHA